MAQRFTIAIPGPGGQDINVGSSGQGGVAGVAGLPVIAPTRVKKVSALTSATTTSQQLFGPNANRLRLVVQNHDASINVFINLTDPAAATGGNFRVGPGGTVELEGTNESVNIIASSGNPLICAWEF